MNSRALSFLILLPVLTCTGFFTGCVSGPSTLISGASATITPDLPETSELLSGSPSPIGTTATEDDATFQIISYNVNHIWGGRGYASRLGGNNQIYRAKLSLKGRRGQLLAQVFFVDERIFDPRGRHQNPRSAVIPEDGYFNLYFPASALPGVQQVLSQPTDRKNLVYYDREWAIESVGDVTDAMPWR